MRVSPYGGVIVALVTPFTEDDQVDYSSAVSLARKLAADGCDGILVSGTTGESPTITRDEKLRLVSEIKEAVSPTAQVWAGTGSYNTKDGVSLTRLAEKAGADGILSVVPYYNKPSQDGLYAHFKAVSESTSLPVMLYNVPGRTSTNMLPETVLRLSDLKNVVAVKEASGSLDQVSAITSACPEDFYVYSGDDSLTLPTLAVGGAGIVSVAAHLVASELKDMIDCFSKGQVKEAWQIHARLFKLFKVLFITSNPVPVKTALMMQGLVKGGFRLPLVPPTREQKITLAKVLEELGLVAVTGA